MKKGISLFKRDYEGDRLVYNEIVPGAEWVIAGDGVATEKYDGICCMVKDNELYKRYDRKLTKSKRRRLKHDKSYVPQIEDFKPSPEGWTAAEPMPDQKTGHWPGWMPISDRPEDKWHREAKESCNIFSDGTYELIGPKIQGNPYQLEYHDLWPHGVEFHHRIEPPREFNQLKLWFQLNTQFEGIVWHHPDKKMVKIKRKDFGFDWPLHLENPDILEAKEVCTIEGQENIPCTLISGDGGKFKLFPDAFDGEPFYTLTLAEGANIHAGDKVTYNDQEYLTQSTMKSVDRAKFYWAILTKA
jgi:hypothetical protein